MSPAAAAVEPVQERTLSAEELHMYFGYSFQNPFPKGSGTPKIIGGVAFPFGTQSVEIQGMQYPIPAGGVLTVRMGPMHRNPALIELAGLAFSGQEIIMLHPNPEIVVGAILEKLSVNAGDGKDAGIRMWEPTKIAGMSKRAVEMYLARLTNEGKEALRNLINSTVIKDITAEENHARKQNRVPNPPHPYQTRMLGVLKGLDEFLNIAGGDSAAQDAALMAKEASKPAGDFASLAAMKYIDLLSAGKKMGLKLPHGIKKEDLIDMISKAGVVPPEDEKDAGEKDEEEGQGSEGTD